EVSSLGMGEIWQFLDQQLQYPVSLINVTDLGRMTAADFNVLIVPNGYYSIFSSKEMNEKLKEWVRGGGKIIASENAVAQMSRYDWGFKMKGADDKKDEGGKEDYNLLKKYGNRERDDLVNSMPGSIFKLELDNSHPLAFGYGNTYYALK